MLFKTVLVFLAILIVYEVGGEVTACRSRGHSDAFGDRRDPVSTNTRPRDAR